VNFMLALNVTIYGLGIVFLALLVLMVAIMLLSKVFSMATGKGVLEIPAPAAPETAPPPGAAPAAPPAAAPPGTEVAEPVIAPLPGKVLSVAVKAGNHVRRGDELCVIEAMKMGNSVKAPRDGVVVEVRVAPGDTVSFGAPLVLLASTVAAAAPRPAPSAPAPPPPPARAAGPIGLTLTVAGAPHAAEVTVGAGGEATVRLDGSSYRVQRAPGNGNKVLVNGQAHTVEVKEMAGSAATVLIDGRTERLEIGREAVASSPGPATATAPTAPATAPPRPAGAGERVTAPLPGKVLSVAVKAGNGVHKGDELCVIEAMKMGNSIRAQRDGTVREVLVAPGQTVAFGAALLVLD
jgi:glutaconyl-CoA decarboxylase